MIESDLSELLYYDNGFLFWKSNKQQACYLDGRYRRVQYNYKKYQAHRLIYIIHFGDIVYEIDHIDQNKTNNLISNLRDVSHSLNERNKPKMMNCSSSLKGVYFDKTKSKWKASIRINGKRKHLGYFNDEIDAGEAYIKALDQVHELS